MISGAFGSYTKTWFVLLVTTFTAYKTVRKLLPDFRLETRWIKPHQRRKYCTWFLFLFGDGGDLVMLPHHHRTSCYSFFIDRSLQIRPHIDPGAIPFYSIYSDVAVGSGKCV